MNDANRELVQRFMMGTQSGDFGSIADLVHDDFVMHWPQSGERFVGRDNAFGAMQITEVQPQMAGEPRLVGDGDVWVLTVPLAYGDDQYQYVAIIEIEESRIKRGTGFWASPFPAQQSRAPFAERSQ